ncbi:hypothetical protein [Streptomyces sp. NPDC026659]|uniref:hypothetical protein n=1 Tax=Streptomyces sp. NPDC026659 TaxID=3155123 RepID=UPI0033EB8C50
MSTTAARRAGLVAASAALALLATACGGSDDGAKGAEGKGDSTASASASASVAAAPVAKPLTAAELEKAALAQADVKKGKVPAKLAATDDIAKERVKADNAACLPLAYAQAGVAQGEPVATVKRSWMGDAKPPVAGAKIEDALVASLDKEKMVVNLASYKDGGAEEALKGLTAAAGKCAGGFTATVDGEKATYTKAAVARAPQGGDEGAAITLTLDAGDGVKAPVKLVALRKGATLATFSVMNFASAATGKDFTVPADAIAAQMGKLG